MSTAFRLYDYVDQLQVVREWIHEHEDEIIAAGGELPPELAELCDAVDQGLTDKVERIGLFIRELESNAAAIEAEVMRLEKRARHYERAAKSLKAYLLYQLQRADIPKVEGTLITVARQKSPPSVQCNLSQNELQFIRECAPRYVVTIPESYRLDAKAVIAAWKAGDAIPDGVTIAQHEHIRLR